MPLIPILIIAAAIGGFLLYEKTRAPAPSPGLRRCVPATTLAPGQTYIFGVAAPAGSPMLTPAAAQSFATQLNATGRWNLSGWVRGDVSAPAFGWPPDAPVNSVLLRGTYTGANAPVAANMLGTMVCTASTPVLLGPGGGGDGGSYGYSPGAPPPGSYALPPPPPAPPPLKIGHIPVTPPPSPCPPGMMLDPAWIVATSIPGGSTTAPKCIPIPGPSPQHAPVHMRIIPQSPPATPDPSARIVQSVQYLMSSTQSAPEDGMLADVYHQIVTASLQSLLANPTAANLASTEASLAKNGSDGSHEAAAAAQFLANLQASLGLTQSGLHLTGQVSDLAPGNLSQVCASIVAQAMAQMGSGAVAMAPAPDRLSTGVTYYASWPVDAQLSNILWKRTTETPPDWLGDATPGRAIGVLVWTGPDGGSDPGVRVYGVRPAVKAA